MRQFLDHAALDVVAVTDVNVLERVRGWSMKIAQAKTRQQLARWYRKLGLAAKFLSRFEIIHVTEAALAHAAELDALVRKRKITGDHKPGKRDLLLAGIILDNPGATLVTHNRKHFVQIIEPERVVDWSR